MNGTEDIDKNFSRFEDTCKGVAAIGLLLFEGILIAASKLKRVDPRKQG